MIIIFKQDHLRTVITKILTEIREDTSSKLDKLKDFLSLGDEVDRLRNEVANLTIQKSQKEEEFARKTREIEHKIGLERVRQSQEVELATKAAKLEVQQSNLDKDKQRFEDQMKFQSDRMTEETKYLKEMMEKILDRLPNISQKISTKQNI